QDLEKLETVELDESGPWVLPGLLSPDRTMSALPSPNPQHAYGNELWLHRLGEDPVRVAEGLGAELSEASSSLPQPPWVWLDNERLLSQRSNGMLVLISTDGTTEESIQIPEIHDVNAHRPISRPRFERNRTGQLIYVCGRVAVILALYRGTSERYEW